MYRYFGFVEVVCFVVFIFNVGITSVLGQFSILLVTLGIDIEGGRGKRLLPYLAWKFLSIDVLSLPVSSKFKLIFPFMDLTWKKIDLILILLLEAYRWIHGALTKVKPNSKTITFLRAIFVLMSSRYIGAVPNRGKNP